MAALAAVIVAAAVVFCIACVLLGGLKIINPNEALVLTLFGKYYGTIKDHGFFFVNPFVTARNPIAEKQNESEGCLLSKSITCPASTGARCR